MELATIMAKQVLIVDDAIFMRVMLRDIFTTAGWQVVAEAADGNEAITCYHKHHPDLVTMDLVMPEMGGIAALKCIIKDYSEARIIVCSALGQKNLIIEAINGGAKDFIVKPFKTAQVLDVVERVIAE